MRANKRFEHSVVRLLEAKILCWHSAGSLGGLAAAHCVLINIAAGPC